MYTYLGRSDDMLRVGGEWVAPAEVEATIIEHPSVLEVAVVGRLDAHGVTRPVAHIVARPGATVEEDDVIEHCRPPAGYKRPTTVVVTESLPKTATGKIQRYKYARIPDAAPRQLDVLEVDRLGVDAAGRRRDPSREHARR